ncbi:MAG: hypothetical protein AVDCRST_MAG56-4477 [uncultured Cytophagales bacterium]|uniref:General stress protein 17M-like domain-containing protein n=1 Tax=uncultured Cytophagales bacterium TaxID=158755 RepID=A0A6J4JX02_9SPHI|nr:MAG: hypothetical protein AVDCRST_MAG56-4477 [uncultured Cytophagales bacterium]
MDNTTSNAPGNDRFATRTGTIMVTGMFPDRDSAERAYGTVSSRGYSKDDVNLIMSDETRRKHFGNSRDDNDTELGTKAAEGAGVGGAIGGTLGGIIGAIAAIGTAVALPGLGLVIAGPIAAGLAGAGAGSITGGLVGALIGAGIPQDRAQEYEQGVKQGGIVMGVHSRSPEDAAYIEDQWRGYHGQNVRR